METPEKQRSLRDIEPLRRVEDIEAEDVARTEEVDRLGRAAATVAGSAPAVGVSAEADARSAPPDDDPLDDLRR